MIILIGLTIGRSVQPCMWLTYLRTIYDGVRYGWCHALRTVILYRPSYFYFLQAQPSLVSSLPDRFQLTANPTILLVCTILNKAPLCMFYTTILFAYHCYQRVFQEVMNRFPGLQDMSRPVQFLGHELRELFLLEHSQ